MKYIYLTIALLLVLSFNFSCNDDLGTNSDIDWLNPKNNIFEEPLSIDESFSIESTPDAIGFDPSTIILPNGLSLQAFSSEIDSFKQNNTSTRTPKDYNDLGPQDAKNKLIKELTYSALTLVNRELYKFDYNKDGIVDQYGLAYSYGQKDETKFQPPPYPKSVCKENIYGLDCSGFLESIFNKSNIKLASPADNQRKSQVLQNSIIKGIPALSKIKVEEITTDNTMMFETGDIIHWKKKGTDIAKHIGIILKNKSGELAVFQSNGDDMLPSDCALNKTPTRGCRLIQFKDKPWFNGGKYYITRISTEISGEWSLSLRCQNQTTDVITLSFDFPKIQKSAFTLNGSGIDYDGTVIHYKATFEYSTLTSLLKGNIYSTKPNYPEFYRNDSLTKKLVRDESDYFNLILGNNHEAGCPVEGRLLYVK
jgi:hypothetical protein